MVGSPKRRRSGATDPGNPGTAGDEKKRRKRLQNRLNQRAFRSRHPQNESTKTSNKKRQYQVDRWQLDEYQTVHSSQASPAVDSPTQHPSSPERNPDAAQHPPSKTTWFPLPHDHLLHLIKYNVFRGLCQNKATLESLAVQYHAPDNPMSAFTDHIKFPRYSVIISKSPHHSGSLTPTPLQMNVVHSTWINFIPFPKIRENLIKWEFAFDHSDLVRDLVGNLINLKIFFSTSSADPLNVRASEEKNDNGLILWGEPHLAESWEATPGFLRKWAWAVAGCQELIDSSNHWREVREEGPLKMLAEN